MKTKSTTRAPRETVNSREEAVQQFIVAANKHLTDRPDRPESERKVWAEKTADTYIKRGIIAILSNSNATKAS